MQHKSNELMHSIKKYIEQFYFANRHSPSTTDISVAFNIGRTTAYRYLIEMSNRGIINYDGKRIKTNKTEKLSTELSSISVLGSISCGTPELSEENTAEIIQFPTSLIGEGEFYLLKASGDSMIDAGIDNGDLILIKKQSSARNGQIVVALIENENTLKRIYKDEHKKIIILHPENKNYTDIVVSECVIQGVAVKVIKNLS